MKGVRELNLEQGRPSVDQALGWLEAELEAARKMNTPLMKLIHGYGSSGKGGRIRTASRKYLLAAAIWRRPPDRGGSRCICRGNGSPSLTTPPAGPCSNIPSSGWIGIWTGRTGA